MYMETGVKNLATVFAILICMHVWSQDRLTSNLGPLQAVSAAWHSSIGAPICLSVCTCLHFDTLHVSLQLLYGPVLLNA